MNIKEALDVILSDKAAYSKSLNFAVNYTRYAKTLPDGHELAVQCMYILNNITGWRHPQAKDVRATLKEYVKMDGIERKKTIPKHQMGEAKPDKSAGWKTGMREDYDGLD